MSTVRGKRPSDPAGFTAYSVTGDAGAISYTPGGTVGVHSVAHVAGAAKNPCHLLPGGACWVSTIPGFGERTRKAFEAGGEDGLYRELESTYRAVFAEGGTR